MRFSISTVALSLLAFSLPLGAVAQDPTTSVSTVTSTRTVYRVTTETQTGTPPASVQNSTSTIHPSGAKLSATGSGAQVTSTGTSSFTGAAARIGNMDAAAAAVVAVAGLLML